MDDDVSTSASDSGTESDEPAETARVEPLPDDAIDEIAFLARSPSRVRVLHLLRRQGPTEKREIRERIDGVRTTATRNLSALEEHGWIDRTAEGYDITDCGRMIADELVELADSMSIAVELRPVLRWLDVDGLGIGVREFERAEITTADSMNPYAPVEEQIELLRGSGSVRTALPTVNKQILRTCRRTVEENGADVTLVLDEETTDRLRSDSRYADLFAEVRRACTLRRHESSLPYYLGIDDETVQLGTTDGNRLTRVLLRFEEDPPVRSWAEERLSELEDAAEPIG